MRNSGTPKRYHHGDLRAALVEAGLRLVEEHAADEVGLREAARDVGVSATAVYRHFPDKAAFLAALAKEGLARLAAAQRAAFAASGSDAAGFAATGRAYVRFALANPGLFRLIFAKAAKPGAEDWASQDEDAMRMLLRNAERVDAPGQGAEGARLAALRAWALVHGLAMLMLDGQVPSDETIVDAVIVGGNKAPG